MSGSFSKSSAAVALALTAVGGYVDAIGYLTLGRVYVANMSGNSVALGIYTGSRDWTRAAHYALPIASFFAGLLLSRGVIGWAVSRGWRSLAAPALALQIAALTGFLVVPFDWPGIVFGGIAMGIQAATLSRFNGATVYTCFVTGSLVRAAEAIASDVAAAIRSGTAKPSSFRRSLWLAFIWVAYVAGAIASIGALGRLGTNALAIAIGFLAALATFDLIAPAAIDRDIATENSGH